MFFLDDEFNPSDEPQRKKKRKSQTFQLDVSMPPPTTEVLADPSSESPEIPSNPHIVALNKSITSYQQQIKDADAKVQTLEIQLKRERLQFKHLENILQQLPEAMTSMRIELKSHLASVLQTVSELSNKVDRLVSSSPSITLDDVNSLIGCQLLAHQDSIADNIGTKLQQMITAVESHRFSNMVGMEKSAQDTQHPSEKNSIAHLESSEPCTMTAHSDATPAQVLKQNSEAVLEDCDGIIKPPDELWIKVKTTEFVVPYYFNVKTGERTWKKPT